MVTDQIHVQPTLEKIFIRDVLARTVVGGSGGGEQVGEEIKTPNVGDTVALSTAKVTVVMLPEPAGALTFTTPAVTTSSPFFAVLQGDHLPMADYTFSFPGVEEIVDSDLLFHPGVREVYLEFIPTNKGGAAWAVRVFEPDLLRYGGVAIKDGPPATGQKPVWDDTFKLWVPGDDTGAAFYADAIIAPGTDVSGGSFANVVILSADGFVEGSPNGVDRAFAVGQRALVPSGADAGLWTITASGACTPDATQPTTGDVVVVDVPISTAWVALGANGVTATSFEPIHKYQTRYQPIATMGVHVGQTMQDGLDDYLYPDPDNLVIADGSQYDGLPVWRTTATDLNGEALGTSVGVCRLTNQNDATIGEFPDADPAYFEAGARNGTFEVFLDSHGVTGRYFVRTVCWNDRLFRDESLLSGTMFWNAIDSTVWATRGNGMASDSEPHTNSGVSLGETSTTAYRGDRGKTAYDHSQTTTGNPHGTTPAEITGFDTAVRTSRLDQMAAAGADVAMGSHKITGLANGASSTDAAAFGQIPTASSSTPAAPGTAAAGSSTSWAKGDHVHPYQASVVGGQDEGTSVTSTTDTSLLDAAIFISGQSTGDTVVGWFTFSHTNTSGTGRTHSIKPKLGATTLGTLSYNCPSGATTSGVGFFVLRSEGASDHNFGAAVFTSNSGVSAFQTVTTENLSTGANLDLLGATGAGGSQTNTLQLTSITRHRA